MMIFWHALIEIIAALTLKIYWIESSGSAGKNEIIVFNAEWQNELRSSRCTHVESVESH